MNTESTYPVDRSPVPSVVRWLAVWAMLASPGLLVAGFLRGDNAGSDGVLPNLCGFVYLSGALAAAVSLRLLNATGKGRGASLLLGVQTIGLVMAMGFDVIEFAAPQLKDTTLFFVTDMAYPASHLLMIVVGISILRARVLSGWRRIPAFLCGLALPAFIACAASVGREFGGPIFVIGVTSGFFLLGLAIFTFRRQEAGLPAPHASLQPQH